MTKVRSKPPPRRARRHGCRQRGSATVWVLALAALVVALAAGLLLPVQVRLARQQAATAADLAALAAASLLPQVDAACAQAARLATKQGVRLSRCTSDGSSIDIEVSRTVPGPWGSAGVVRVRSRAGPPAPR